MPFRYIITVLLMLGINVPAHGEEQQTVPDHVYPALEYILSLPQTNEDLDPEKLSALIQFVGSVPTGSGMSLLEREGAAGAFHAFSINGDLSSVLQYAYNPDIPAYVTMPSSLQNQEWLTPKINEELRNLAGNADSTDDILLLRGREREAITPDTNTGGYYMYNQDRIVAVLPGPNGPVLISATNQADASEVGKKGCVVGDDTDWNYLYSDETGLNKTGLGWVDSYMYSAYSVIIYVSDPSKNMLRVGSFKWLNAGWAKINMVKSNHILDGIRRFASAFKAVLESPGLPEASVLADKYRELVQKSKQELRQRVSPYLQALNDSEVLNVCSNPFKSMVPSGKYLQEMSHGEMVRVLLLEYVKGNIGKEPLSRIDSGSAQSQALASQP
jgi:hypothetical protein